MIRFRDVAAEPPEAVARNSSGERRALVAEFLCLSCAREWSRPQGATCCPGCGHLYVEWTNYETMVQQSNRPRTLVTQRPPRIQGALSLQGKPFRAFRHTVDQLLSEAVTDSDLAR